MSTRGWGIVLIALGVIVALIAVFADVLGLGAQPGVIGWKQMLGAGAGVLSIIAGTLMLIRARTSR